MICEGVFREDCLSLCSLQASSAAASHIMSDEGTRSVSETGRVSLVTFFARTKKVTRANKRGTKCLFYILNLFPHLLNQDFHFN
jgi:hypothetical protein